MLENDFRSAAEKITASEAFRAETLERMKKAEGERAVRPYLRLARQKRSSRMWGTACAAALVLAAIPVVWQVWNTPSLPQSGADAQSQPMPQTAQAEAFAAPQPAALPKERSMVSAQQYNDAAAGEDLAASMNPTAGLTSEELPDALPVYYEPVQEDEKVVLERTAKALGVSVDAYEETGQEVYAASGEWKLSVRSDAVRVEAQDAVLIPLEQSFSLGQAVEAYAERLSGTSVWKWDGADTQTAQCFDVSGETLEQRLYHYCFDRLTIEMDENGNVKALECRVPQLQRGETVTLLSVEQAQSAASLKEQSIRSHEISYRRDEAGVWSPVYVFYTDDAQSEPLYVDAVQK